VKSSCRILPVVLSVTLYGLSLIARGEQPPRYEMVDLSASWGGSIEATAINNSGLIAGRFWTADQTIHAFLYQNGVVQDLAPVEGGDAYIFDLNDAGQFVGGFPESFRGNPPLQLPPGFQAAFPAGLNNLGVIVGTALDNALNEVPFVYSNGVFTALPVMAYGQYSAAVRVNNQGLVIGDSYDSNGHFFAVTYAGTNLTNLGTLPGDNFSSANALNDLGHVVGVSGKFDPPDEITEETGFIYREGQMAPLPMLRHFATTIPFAINKHDQIVGFCDWLGSDGTSRQTPFLVTNGRIHDVNELLAPRKNAIHIEYVNDINDEGWIVGSGYANGISRAILLRPIGKASGSQK
jgi:probable HAF family extracellular repeat protein